MNSYAGSSEPRRTDMARRESDAQYWARDAARRRQIEEIFGQMQERYRRADEREERRRERLRKLTFGLLGRA
jgi:hypothetical protein